MSENAINSWNACQYKPVYDSLWKTCKPTLDTQLWWRQITRHAGRNKISCSLPTSEEASFHLTTPSQRNHRIYYPRCWKAVEVQQCAQNYKRYSFTIINKQQMNSPQTFRLDRKGNPVEHSSWLGGSCQTTITLCLRIWTEWLFNLHC